MSTRPTQRAPKGRTRDRADRRAVLDVLLARAQRGVLSAAEGALLAQHVREEQRLADENRRAMSGTTRALDRHRAAADAAIVEAEQRAAQAEGDARQYQQQTSRVRHLAHRMRAGSPQGAAAIYAERIEQALDGDRDALAVEATVVHAAFAAAADSTEARLAEQQREHDIALATAEGRIRRLGASMQRTVDHYREQAKTGEQRLTAVRAVLPSEPRPRLGLPNDLAYANGMHDLADAVRDALGTAGRP